MELWVCHLGRVEYREAAALQEQLRERVIAGSTLSADYAAYRKRTGMFLPRFRRA